MSLMFVLLAELLQSCVHEVGKLQLYTIINTMQFIQLCTVCVAAIGSCTHAHVIAHVQYTYVTLVGGMA